MAASDLQAGGHPDFTTSFAFTTLPDPNFFNVEFPEEDVRDIVVKLPVGFAGNPEAYPHCKASYLANVSVCPIDTQVGVLTYDLALIGQRQTPVYNMVPQNGNVAELGFNVSDIARLHIDVSVRTGADYGVTATVPTAAGNLALTASSLTLWGVPADPSHDGERGDAELGGGHGCLSFDGPNGQLCPSGVAPRPFMVNPTQCDADGTSILSIDSWQHPGSFLSYSAAPQRMTGCDKLGFDPSIGVRPTSHRSDDPTGLDVGLDVPQPWVDRASALATSHLRGVAVTLPAGLTVNPASADGLAACSDEQVGLHDAEAARCPDASKIGTVTVESPVLSGPIDGGVYVGTQRSDDPASGEMFRIFLALEGRGVRVKLVGAVKVDPATGRIETVFKDNPQLPVSRISLHLKSGERAPLATPPDCGPKTVDAELSSWSGHVVDLTDTVSFDCPGSSGFAPSLEAGSLIPTAGAFSPFVVRIDRADRQQYLDGVTVELPTGLSARLRGVPLCAADRAAAGTCGIESRVGSATVGAGPGASPFVLAGQPVYLAGPYKGAPYSLSVVTRAIAGPYDLGTVVVRQALYVDPTDAHITVVSDPLPTILKGVPLRLRSVNVDVDRPGFTLNPTSCAEKQIKAVFHSQQGSSATQATRFQVGDCRSLALKPKLTLALTGKRQLTDGKHPGLKAVLTQPSRQANLKQVSVKLPLSLALDPANAVSDSLCSFEESRKAEPKCPASSIVGSAKAITPVLDKPLAGNVYFAKNVRISKTGQQIRTLPTLLVALRGEVSLNLLATSTVKGGRLVNTFQTVPDAPVSRFELSLKGGKKGILVVNGKACKRSRTVLVDIDGHNGKRVAQKPEIAAPCGKAGKAKRTARSPKRKVATRAHRR